MAGKEVHRVCKLDLMSACEDQRSGSPQLTGPHGTNVRTSEFIDSTVVLYSAVQ